MNKFNTFFGNNIHNSFWNNPNGCEWVEKVKHTFVRRIFPQKRENIDNEKKDKRASKWRLKINIGTWFINDLTLTDDGVRTVWGEFFDIRR